MSLFSGKWFIVVIGAMIGLLFITGSVGNFGIRWDSSNLQCYGGKKWEHEDWHVKWQIWKFQWAYKPVDYKCPAGYEYDPKQYDQFQPGATNDQSNQDQRLDLHP